MTLDEILAAVDELPPEDRERLKQHLNRQQEESKEP
jgi:hypothetical protein